MRGAFTKKANSLALFQSNDGLQWQLAEHPLVTTPIVKNLQLHVNFICKQDACSTSFSAMQRGALLTKAAAFNTQRDIGNK
jgi:hypothetical protein